MTDKVRETIAGIINSNIFLGQAGVSVGDAATISAQATDDILAALPAALAGARNAALEEAVSIVFDYPAGQHGNLASDPHEAARQVRDEIHNSVRALKSDPAPRQSVKEAAQVLLTPDELGGRSMVYDACEGRCKVHRFDAVLRALSQKEQGDEPISL